MRELYLENLETRSVRVVARTGSWTDMGRPAVRAGRVAWSITGPAASWIGLYTIATRARRVVARSAIGILAFPSLTASRIAWVDQRAF